VLLVCLLPCVFSLNFVSNALGSNMVLQRAPQRAVIWGWSKTVGSNVQVTFANKVYPTTSTTGGAWNVFLDATPAGGPYTINVTSSTGESALLSNVLFGDVWICSGQSNMQFTVSLAFNASAEIADADKYPNIRLFTVGQGTTSPTPLVELATIEQYWAVASSKSVGGNDWGYFSAVCWFFGKRLYQELNIPIGLVNTNWGGTVIQAWSSPKALTECAGLDEEISEDYEKERGPNDPSQLWNAMIVPLLPMRSRGTIWYQAEQNVGQTAYYTCAFPAMISDWRTNWGYTPQEFPFFFVQLSTWFPSDMNLPAMRLAQVVATSLPYVGFATAADLGDATSPEGSIHPRDKQDVGKRLSLAVLSIAYGHKVNYLGPTPTYANSLTPFPKAAVEVHFRPESLAHGLLLKQTPVCPTQVPSSLCGTTFELQSSDGKWQTATGSVTSRNTLVITANVGVGTVPIAVRYINFPWPLATLYNSNDGYDLPAPPFYLPVVF